MRVAETLSAGWPLGLALAAAAGGRRVGSARRRAALNRALHELRRPLQVLALSGPSPSRAGGPPGALDLAIAAVDDLDREINGSAAGSSLSAPRPEPRRSSSCRSREP